MQPQHCVPGHMTAMYMLAVITLLALLNIALVESNVVVMNRENTTIDELPDMPARFGPVIPAEAIWGHVVYVTPRDSCRPVNPPPQRGQWIALMKRGNCDFDVKVLHAQKRGYVAVLVHNVGSDSLVPMGPGHWSKNVTIPAVFIGETDGLFLAKHFDKNPELWIGLDNSTNPDRPINWEVLMTVALSVLGGCVAIILIITIAILVVKWVRDVRRKRRSRLSLANLKKIPVKKFKKGDPYDLCAICLDEYEEGEKLRILPCSHAYHQKCIDPWLTKNKRTCPICKRKVIPGDDNSDDSESDGEEQNGNETSTERTPLLGAPSARTRPFGNAGLASGLSSAANHIPYTDTSSEDSLDLEAGSSVHQSSVVVHNSYPAILGNSNQGNIQQYGTTSVAIANEMSADTRSMGSQTEEVVPCEQEAPGALGGIANPALNIVEDHFDLDPLMGEHCPARRSSDNSDDLSDVTQSDTESDLDSDYEVSVVNSNKDQSSSHQPADV